MTDVQIATMQRRVNENALSSAIELIDIQVSGLEKKRDAIMEAKEKSWKTLSDSLQNEIDSLNAASRVLDNMFMNV